MLYNKVLEIEIPNCIFYKNVKSINKFINTTKLFTSNTKCTENSSIPQTK